ncbi:hypothetical protein A2U01_0078387, partial [Trifolium medium]|nr:hypothetical protein [Trifolium medium]
RSRVLKSHIDYGNMTCFEVEEVDVKVYRAVSDSEEDWKGGVPDCITSVVVEFARRLSRITVKEICIGSVTRD